MRTSRRTVWSLSLEHGVPAAGGERAGSPVLSSDPVLRPRLCQPATALFELKTRAGLPWPTLPG